MESFQLKNYSHNHVEDKIMMYTKANNMYRLLRLILLIALALAPTQIANAAVINKRISGTMPSFGDVDYIFARPQISPDGRYVVYVADQLTDGVNELFSVPVTGMAPPTRISGPLPIGSQVDQFSISPDSTRVVYLVVGTDGMGGNYTELQ